MLSLFQWALATLFHLCVSGYGKTAPHVPKLLSYGQNVVFLDKYNILVGMAKATK